MKYVLIAFDVTALQIAKVLPSTVSNKENLISGYSTVFHTSQG